MARTAASPAVKWDVMPPIRIASVTTSPVKPSSLRRIPVTTGSDSDAGIVPFVSTSTFSPIASTGLGGFGRAGAGVSSSAGIATWATMTDSAPALMPARNGTSSTDSRRGRSAPTIGSERCESIAVSPCPGKCLSVARTPPAFRPFTVASTYRETSAGSSPKLLTLMTGLSGFTLTSATGAKTCAMPIARASRAVASAPRSASAGSPAAAIAIAHGPYVTSSKRIPRPASRSAETRSGTFASSWSFPTRTAAPYTFERDRMTPPTWLSTTWWRSV